VEASDLQNPWVVNFLPAGRRLVTARHGRTRVGNRFAGALETGYLDCIELAEPFNGEVEREHKRLADPNERIRDVRQGPDGLPYVLTDSAGTVDSIGAKPS
jgi:hypothetical protein